MKNIGNSKTTTFSMKKMQFKVQNQIYQNSRKVFKKIFSDTPPVSDSKEKILLVDDQWENLKLATDFLKEHDFEILTAKSGSQALKILEKTSPDLIILDVVMPEMDGFETCCHLKAWDKTKDIPVIFMTAVADFANPAMKVEGLMLGAVDYISKPIQMDEVVARVKTHLQLHSLSKQLQQQNAQLQHEIEARKQIEAEIIRSKDLLESIFNESADAIFLVNIETGLITDCNRRAVELFDAKSKDELLNIEVQTLQKAHFTPEELRLIVDKIERYGVWSRELEYFTLNGQLFWGNLAAKRIHFAGQKMHLVRVTDITKRKLAEEKLKQSQAALAEAQRVAHVGNWSYDLLTKKITWSEELFRIFGLDITKPEPTYPQLLKKILPEDRAVFQRAVALTIKLGICYQFDFRIWRADGQLRHLEARGEAIFNDSGEVVKLFGTVLDISDRKRDEEALRLSEAREREKAQALQLALEKLKRTQAQLIQTEKMSSLGRMVAGVAHEINNPISFIYGNLAPAREYFQDLLKLIQLYQQTYPTPRAEIQELTSEIDLEFLIEDWQQLIHSMQVGAERIEQIVLSLKNFSRLDEKQLKAVDIHEGIENSLLILRHQLRSEGERLEIQVIKNYAQLPKVTCYASQLNQVFINLLSNAIDALKNQPSPRVITIRTEVKTEDGELKTMKNHPNPLWVVIRIADNGAGMSQEVQKKIFDPFFTTKPVGSGTGLGLSICHQIVVEKHQGRISHVSAPGQGTEMIVEIPVRYPEQRSQQSHGDFVPQRPIF